MKLCHPWPAAIDGHQTTVSGASFETGFCDTTTLLPVWKIHMLVFPLDKDNKQLLHKNGPGLTGKRSICPISRIIANRY